MYNRPIHYAREVNNTRNKRQTGNEMKTWSSTDVEKLLTPTSCLTKLLRLGELIIWKHYFTSFVFKQACRRLCLIKHTNLAEKVFPCSVLVGTFKETRGKKNSIICAWKYLEHSSFDSITVHLSGECSICYETSVQGFIWHMNRSHVIDVQDFTDTTWTNATAEGYENTKKIRENFHLFLMCRYIWRNEFATQY